MRRQIIVLFLAGQCTWLAGCRLSPQQADTQSPPPAPAQTAQVQKYDLRGKVVAVDKANKRLTVDHEAIPGFMGAMTMSYSVKDAHLLDNLSQGELVTAKVISAGTDYWLEDVSPAGQSR